MSDRAAIESIDRATGLPVRQFALTGNGGLRLAATCREPATDARAIVVFAHGYTAFAEAYSNVLTTLALAGMRVYAVDHRGHGQSQGKRGSLDRLDDVVEDFERLVAIARAEHAGLPVFTLGHSMGGLIVARHALRFQEGLAGTIPVSAALVVGDQVSATETRLLMALSKIFPDLPAIGDDQVHDPGIGAPPRQRWRNFLSYRGKVRLNMARELYQGGLDTLSRAAEWKLPVFLLHGDADTVTMPSGSEQAFANASSLDRTLELWPGRLHNLITDEGWEEPVKHIVEWLLERSAK